MRALRVVGLADGGKTVICEDPARGERFTLPADERLRAAARGDVTRLGQIEIELESQMRPREIQARIRAGESVEQVAEAAGIPTAKVERFAYPVLLERSRTADLAQRAHPVREDGPDLQTLGEICLNAFTLRGQDYTAATWDSWRGEDGKWVVQLCWTAGRSVNRAHWAFHPGAHGGTVSPLDEHSHDLLDPQPTRPLRTVRPVTELAQAALSIDPALLAARPEPAALEATPVGIGEIEPPVAPVPTPAQTELAEPARPAAGYESAARVEPARPAAGYETASRVEPARPAAGYETAARAEPARPVAGYETAARPEPARQPGGYETRPAEATGHDPEARGYASSARQAGASEQVARETGAHEPVRRSGEPDDAAVVHQPVAHEPVVREPVVRQPVAYTRSTTKPGAVPKEQPAPEPEPTDPTAREHQDFVEDFELTPPVEPEPAAEAPDQAALIEEPARKAEPPRRGKGKKARPIVPSWEDVLLGTRSNRG